MAEDYEIIYIDNGSTDKSFEVLADLKTIDNRIRLIAFDRNYGKTAAVDTGLRNANGDYVLTIDADLQFDNWDLQESLLN